MKNEAAVSPLTAGLRCCCPRCGKGQLFRQLLNLRETCSSCGLDYKFVDTGDGPAVFAIFILGFLAMAAVLTAEFKFGAPWWVHALILGVATPIAAVFLLRFLKAVLIALQFKHKAEEGRLASKDNPNA